LVIFVLIERGKHHAMLDVGLLRTPSFAAMMLAALMLNACAFANLALVSVWLQSAQGLDPISTGLVFMPLSITAFVVAAITGRQMHRMTPKIPVGVGLLLIGIGLLLQTRISADSSWADLLVGLFVIGLGVGMCNPALTDAALAAAPVERVGMAGGATNTFRQLGYAIAIAALGTIFALRAKQYLGAFPSPDLAVSALSSGQSRKLIAGLPASLAESAEQAIDAAFSDGLRLVFQLSAVGALLAGIVALVFVKSSAQKVRPESRGSKGMEFSDARRSRGRHRAAL